MSIGDRVRQAREAAKLSQEALAREVTCASMSVSRIERDYGTPNLTILTRIAKRLGKRLDWLVTGEGPEDRETSQTSTPPAAA
jgi:transcriptional regulator with XRE-family HTH domain